MGRTRHLRAALSLVLGLRAQSGRLLRTSLSRIAPRLKRMTLRMTTTETMNMGKTKATAILRARIQGLGLGPTLYPSWPSTIVARQR